MSDLVNYENQPRLLLPQASDMSPAAELIRVVKRHMRVALGITAAVTLAAGLVTFALPKRYTATASVYVLPETPDPLQAAQSGSRGLSDDEVNTQSSLMRGRDLAVGVVAKLGIGSEISKPGISHQILCRLLPDLSRCAPPQPPSLDGRVDAFLSRLAVAGEQRSRVIDLTYVDSDPARAAAALNLLVERYQQQQITTRTADISRTSGWLSQRADDLRRAWLAAEEKAGAFRAASGLTSGYGDRSNEPLVSQQVGHAATDLSTAQAELAAAQARQNALHAAVASGGLSQVTQDPTLVALAAQLSQLEVQRAELRASHGSRYPAVAAIEQQIAAARGQVAMQSQRALHAVDTEVAAKRAAVAALSGNLNTLRGQASQSSGKQVSLATLDNEAHDARAAYQEFLTRAKQLDDRTELLQPQVQFASHAPVPGAPSFPNKPKFLLGGLALGMLCGIGVALSREHFARGFNNVSRISEELSLPLLCAVPKLPVRNLRRIAQYVADNPLSAAAESVRALGAHLQLVAHGGEAPRCVVIASATGGEGKTTTAIWLATALSQAGRKVLLIDGDHRRGTILHRLEGRPGAGFAELVSGQEDPARLTQRDMNDRFDYITAGTPMTRPFGPAEFATLQSLLDRFRNEYDLVIIDTPPLLAMTDALIFAQIADATIFVCRWNSTTRQAVAGSINRLARSGASLIGVALTMVDRGRLSLFSDEYRRADQRLIEGYYSH